MGTKDMQSKSTKRLAPSATEEKNDRKLGNRKKQRAGRTFVVVLLACLLLACLVCYIPRVYTWSIARGHLVLIPPLRLFQADVPNTEGVHQPLPYSTATPLSERTIDGWLGNYEGTAEGYRESYLTDRQGNDYVDVDWLRENELVWVEIFDHDDCVAIGFCHDDTNWGIEIGYAGHSSEPPWGYTNIRVYLPDDLSDVPGMNLTESVLIIYPTPGHPYDVVLELYDGIIEGYLFLSEVPAVSGSFMVSWTIDNLTAGRSNLRDPAVRQYLHCTSYNQDSQACEQDILCCFDSAANVCRVAICQASP